MRIPNELIGFDIVIRIHTDEAWMKLNSTERLRNIVGVSLDDKGLQEEVDYTLEISHRYIP